VNACRQDALTRFVRSSIILIVWQAIVIILCSDIAVSIGNLSNMYVLSVIGPQAEVKIHPVRP
jgi:hypothetical protein